MNIQIEEIAKVIAEQECDAYKYGRCIYDHCDCDLNCSQGDLFIRHAEALYNAGYRNEKEIAKEVFQKIYTYYKTNSADYLSEYFLTDLKEMAQEFSVEVE